MIGRGELRVEKMCRRKLKSDSVGLDNIVASHLIYLMVWYLKVEIDAHCASDEKVSVKRAE